MIYSNIEPMVFEVFARHLYSNQNLGRRNVYSLLSVYLLDVKIMADSFKECVANAIKNQLSGDRTLSVDDVMDLMRVVYVSRNQTICLGKYMTDLSIVSESHCAKS